MTFLLENLAPPDGREMAEAVERALAPFASDPTEARRAVLLIVLNEIVRTGEQSPWETLRAAASR